MDDKITQDEVEERVAATAEEFLRTVLQVARMHAEDQETVDTLAGLTAVELAIRVVDSQIQLELRGDIDGGARRIYAATFKKDGVLH